MASQCVAEMSYRNKSYSKKAFDKAIFTSGVIAILQDSFHSVVGIGVSPLMSCHDSLYNLALHAFT